MSEKVKGVLVRLADALGGLVQVKEFIAKELRLLEDEVEEVLGLKPEDNTLAPAAALCGHGAGLPPGAPTPVAEGNDAPAAPSTADAETPTTPAPDAGTAESAPDAGAPTGEAPGAGDTTQPATSAPSEAETAPASEGAKVAE